MGYWLMAQCDTYTPAASAAKDAFEAAFPPSKQPEAIAFCKDEITSVSSQNCSLFFFPQIFKGYKAYYNNNSFMWPCKRISK